MASYPRNNLNEQLAAKSRSGTAVNGSGTTMARSARQQAGLAREMSGLAQYVGLALSFGFLGLKNCSLSLALPHVLFQC